MADHPGLLERSSAEQQQRLPSASATAAPFAVGPPMRPAFYPRAGRPQGRPCGRATRGLGSRPSSLGSGRAVMNGPDHERSTTMASTNPIITLFGNLGGTPDVRTLPAQDTTRHVYDP